MPERFTIDDYFAAARTSEEKPLVAPETVPALLAEKDRPRVPATPAKKPVPWLAPVLGLGLTAAVVAVFMLLPDMENEPVSVARRDAPTQREQQDMAASQPLPDAALSSPGASDAAETMSEPASASAPTATEQPSAMKESSGKPEALSVSAVPPGTIAGPALMMLDTEQLTALGITVRNGKASYTSTTAPNLPEIARRLHIPAEKLLQLIRDKAINLDAYTTPMQVVIRTDGIGTPARELADTPPLTVAPRIVSVYASGRLMATTWQKQDDALVEQLRTSYTELQDVRADSSLNSLVPVYFRIEDPRNAYFREADVILWYEASPELVRKLPEPYRSRLLGELAPVDDTHHQPGDRFLDTWRTASGAVLSSSLYPNPVSGSQTTLRFNLSETRKITVAVHDIFGRRVTPLQQSTLSGEQTMSITLPALLENGMYLVVLTTDRNEQVVQRLLLQR